MKLFLVQFIAAFICSIILRIVLPFVDLEDAGFFGCVIMFNPHVERAMSYVRFFFCNFFKVFTGLLAGALGWCIAFWLRPVNLSDDSLINFSIEYTFLISLVIGLLMGMFLGIGGLIMLRFIKCSGEDTQEARQTEAIPVS
jgi:hypothetical protein